MKIAYSKTFIRVAKALSPGQRSKLLQRIELFTTDPLHPTLRNHALKGKYKQYRSIDIAGDIRALYLQQEDEIIFDIVGTHSQLYG
jgi:addiction module RelE/StbE family toxin